MKLIVYQSDVKIHEVDLDIARSGSPEITFSLGRAKGSFVKLNDSKISRNFLEVSYMQNIWFVEFKTDLLMIKDQNNQSVTINNKIQITSSDMYFFANYSISFIDNSIELDQTKTMSIADLTNLGNISDKEKDTETEIETSQEVFSDDIENKSQNTLSKIEMEIDDLEDEKEEFIEDSIDENNQFEINDNNENIDSISDSNPNIEELDDSEQNFDSFEDQNSQDFIENDNNLEEYNDEYDNYQEEEGELEVTGDSTEVLQLFSKIEIHLSGEYAPFEYLLISDKQTFIGRDSESCQICLHEEEVSSVHAVIRKNNLTLELEDLNSANGTILNGHRIKKAFLANDDEFIIGSTTFSTKITSDFIDKEADRLMPVEKNQEIEVEEIVDVLSEEGENFGAGIEQSSMSKNKSLFSKEALKDPAKRKKLLIYAVVLMAVWMVLDDSPKKKKVKHHKKDQISKGRKLNKNKNKNYQKNIMADKNLAKLSKMQIEQIETNYQIANSLFKAGKYDESMREIEKIFVVTKEYKNVKQLYLLSKEAMKRLEEIAIKEKKDKEKKALKLKVKILVEKARAAVKSRKVALARGIIGKILELDPENFEVTQLKMEIESYVSEQDKKRVAKALLKAERQRQQDDLSPGKSAFLKHEWFSAIAKLEKFLNHKNLDVEFITEASKMLNTSKINLDKQLKPILTKARSLLEGQDLKGAYEQYKLLLTYDPVNPEALNQKSLIMDKIEDTAKNIYREAIVLEGMNLFEDAKQKFKDVQEVSPSDNKYYKKATMKLKSL